MISVIIPVYNEKEVLKVSYEKLKETMEKSGESYELVFINDGSRDISIDILRDIARADDNVVVLNFSRNFGHQAAVTAGMANAKGDAAIIIDCDLQDPPYVMLDMISKWKDGYDIVYGKRLKRDGESFFKKFTAKVYYKVVGGLSDVKIPKDAGDFRLIDRKVLDTINSLPEHNRYLRGLNAWVGFKTFALEYHREARFAGETKYTMKKMVKLASDGIISNSNKPLSIAFKAGIGLLFIAGVALVTLLTLNILFWTSVIAFCPTLEMYILDVLFGGVGLCLLSNGITNAYVARIYDEVKNRPNYIIGETINLNKSKTAKVIKEKDVKIDVKKD